MKKHPYVGYMSTNIYSQYSSTSKHETKQPVASQSREPEVPLYQDPYQYLRRPLPLQCFIRNAKIDGPYHPLLIDFLQACRNGVIESVVNILGKLGSSVDALKVGLSVAIRDQQLEVAKKLLELGAQWEDEALRFAQSVEMCELLAANGLDFSTLPSQYNPVLGAIHRTDEVLTKWLIAQRAPFSNIALEEIATYSTPEVLALLVERGQDLESTNVLHVAVGMASGDTLEDRLPMVDYLLSLGLDVNRIADDELGTRLQLPLKYAAQGSLTVVVKRLLEAGADPFLKAKFGSPVGMAIYRGYDDLVEEYAKYRKEGDTDPVEQLRKSRKREPRA
ncbi:ankyrin [Polyplosphaeria fusca]|uniref:Ankyrin n=1 Tax=Polyplosphaeria fusca TaxID=682080 RepID=A0A9P4QP73_9PLEO|nr:ankyrin [Polyplosphaeria fusca]